MRRLPLIAVMLLLLVVAIAVTSLAQGEDTIAEPSAIDEAYLQVVHLAPFAMDPNTAVTVTLDAKEVLTDFVYGESQKYITVEVGTYDVEIFPEGETEPAITGSVSLEKDKYYTAIATGDGTNQPLGLKALLDDNSAPAAGKFKLRLGHLAPFGTGVITADVRLQDGTPVLQGVDFGDVMTDYLELAAGEWDLKITTPGGDVTLIDPLPVDFAAGGVWSAFAAGDGANQPLGVYGLPLDKDGFFLPLASYLQVVHLAPFAMDPNTAVTVTLDTTDVLTDFVYGESTEYLTVAAGMHDVEIYPDGQTEPAITVSITQRSFGEPGLAPMVSRESTA